MVEDQSHMRELLAAPKQVRTPNCWPQRCQNEGWKVGILHPPTIPAQYWPSKMDVAALTSTIETRRN